MFYEAIAKCEIGRQRGSMFYWRQLTSTFEVNRTQKVWNVHERRRPTFGRLPEARSLFPIMKLSSTTGKDEQFYWRQLPFTFEVNRAQKVRNVHERRRPTFGRLPEARSLFPIMKLSSTTGRDEHNFKQNLF